MIGIVKYRAGNLASVSNALDRLHASYRISDVPEELEECSGILFPGVGHAASAMEDLEARGLDTWLRETSKPVLGICLGLQLLYESTAEGECRTLGILPGRLERFDSTEQKVPHMGWNRVEPKVSHPLLDGLSRRDYFYFVHSYYAPVNEYTIAGGTYGVPFAAVAARKNYMGVQFHPEKSGTAGARLLKNFTEFVQVQPESQ
ncbi:MAG: imidazole glycerol phosphate synthase subunit HisH [Balneolaceae bacterium]